jgi:hypothetical protein
LERNNIGLQPLSRDKDHIQWFLWIYECNNWFLQYLL